MNDREAAKRTIWGAGEIRAVAGRSDNTLYRRPLPADTIAFSSPDGRQVFAEALATGGLDGYFPLAEQFHTQSDPSFCGLGSLVVALNALGIDPGRLWKGPWRWFGEEMLDCCVPLEAVRAAGLTPAQGACPARRNRAPAPRAPPAPPTQGALCHGPPPLAPRG